MIRGMGLPVIGVTVRFTVMLVFVPALVLASGCGGPTSSPAASSLSEEPTEGAASVGGFLRNDGRFDTLVELMSARDVPGHDAPFIEVIDTESDPSTLFAPTDAAFEALGSGVAKKMLDAPWLTSVLEKHIAHGTHTSADLRDGQLQTWGTGSHVTVEVRDGRIEYGGAQVIEGDVKVGDWVIHVTDSVVLPSFVESQLSS